MWHAHHYLLDYLWAVEQRVEKFPALAHFSNERKKCVRPNRINYKKEKIKRRIVKIGI
jgi:hypothetical protein